MLLVVVRDGSEEPVFNEAHLRYLEEVVGALAPAPGVEDVVALTTLKDLGILSRQLPPLPVPLVDPDAPPSSGEREALRSLPLLRGIVSEDGTASASWVLLDEGLRARPDYLAAVRAIAERLPPPGDPSLRAWITGFPLLQEATVSLLWRDGLVLLVSAVVVVSGVAALGGVGAAGALAFLAAWPAIAGTLAALAWIAGARIGLFGNAVLPLLLITSGASMVHLGRARRRGSAATRPVLVACALAALTTAAGFGSLATSGLVPLASLGLAVAVGSVVAFGWTSLAILAATRPPPPGACRGAGAPPPRPRRRALPLAALLAVPWFALDPGRLAPTGDLLDVLPADHPEAERAREAAALIGAQTAFEVIVAADDQQLLDPDFLLELVAFEDALVDAAGGAIPFVLSPVTLLRHLDTKLRPEAADRGVARETAEYAVRHLVQPFLRHFRGRDLGGTGPIAEFADAMRQLLSTQGDRLRFGCRIPRLAPGPVLELRRSLRNGVFEPWRQRLGVPAIYATGYAVLVAAAAEEVRSTQVRSLAASGAVLALLLLVVLRSWRLWLLAVAVNAATVAGILNVAWLGDAELGLFSAVLTASLLGVLVDDTIHFAHAFRRAAGTPAERAAAAVAAVGRSIGVSSLCLAAGFALFALSALSVYRQFAWTAVLAVALALLWDLGVLPRLLARRG